MKTIFSSLPGFVFIFFISCSGNASSGHTADADTLSVKDSLPKPYATKSSVNFSKVTGWPEHTMPKAPAGFSVSLFAGGLNNPRWIYVAPNGDILVSEARTEKSGIKKTVSKIIGQDASQNQDDQESGNRIILFRDTDNDGVPDVTSVFLSGMNQPFGMLIIGKFFYVANTDGLYRYPYTVGAVKITGAATKIVALPAGGYNNHWTRNIITNEEQNKIFISVGSGSNVAEHGIENEVRRANILMVDLDGSHEQIYASGLRNPVGMDWAPGSRNLWTAVNERDELGDDLVPDYLTSVKQGAFYGWPYAYWGPHPDPRLKGERMDLVRKTTVPDVSLGAHTASLGLVFNKGKSFPEEYTGGAFIGQHGSWNRSSLVGYKVVYVPFQNGKPSGQPHDFLTGFIAKEGGDEVYGRPVGVAFSNSGYMLVADDAANKIWCIKANQSR